ncbi:HAD-superfamily phosphatase [Piedraia hortae CBS 480.64]|uniref:HAD-superfamily phosphatase n=1 Tax=Piedraia hortae CBS 480.64 TaxID=1314780 RepID=A0A6A7BY91_9PEZI|nr:HAD-superfamily phosphatase [Piedraia hortae CBS 480.64]
MNLSGSAHFFRLFTNPSLCLPHYTIHTFDQLPVPLFPEKDIRAIILDKDNCFAQKKTNTIHPPYRQKFEQLRAAYPGNKLIIVSNTAGSGDDPSLTDAARVEKATGVAVLPHSTKKPGCGVEVLKFLREADDVGITSPSQVAVVGDRLFTDVMMANTMGAHAVWVRDGVVEDRGLLTRVEKGLERFLTRRGYVPPDPRSQFE